MDYLPLSLHYSAEYAGYQTKGKCNKLSVMIDTLVYR